MTASYSTVSVAHNTFGQTSINMLLHNKKCINMLLHNKKCRMLVKLCTLTNIFNIGAGYVLSACFGHIGLSKFALLA